MQRHPSLRWLVPFACVAALVALAAESINTATSDSSLPLLSVSTLVADVKGAHPPFSGAVVAELDDGAGALGSVVPAPSLAVLAAGTHSLLVWYGGRSQQRVAVVGALSETDVFEVGNDMWQWNSADRVAIHSKVPAYSRTIASLGTLPGSLTPLDLADDALAAADVDTSISIAGAATVANRPVYGLVVRPTSANTLIDYIYIAVDGATKTPLGVQVYSRGASDPAIDVSFTDVRFAPQPANTFTFSPPDGATVRDEVKQPAAARVTVTTHGQGWTSVLCVKGAPPRTEALPLEVSAAVQQSKVKGGWGKGRLVQSPLMSVLVTNDGRFYTGAVPPDVLYAAAKK